MLFRQLHIIYRQIHSLIKFSPFINNNHLHINVIQTIAYNLQTNPFIDQNFPHSLITITYISMLSKQLHIIYRQIHSLIKFSPFINNSHLHINVSRQLHTISRQIHSLIKFSPFINNNHLHINVSRQLHTIFRKT